MHKLKNKLNTTKNRIIFVSSSAVALLLLLNIYIYLYKTYHLAIPCIFHKITNLYCPGCGATRVVIALFSLDFKTALRQNAVLTFLLPILALYYLDKIVSWTFNKPTIIAHKIPKIFWYIMVVILIIFCVLRNIPALDFLRPISI